MKLETNIMSYGGNGKVVSLPPAKKDCGCGCNGAGTCGTKTAAQPSASGQTDFTKMTPAEKIAYHRARWDRILGK
jgi:hypothetical protein